MVNFSKSHFGQHSSPKQLVLLNMTSLKCKVMQRCVQLKYHLTFKLYCTVNVCSKFTASNQVKYLSMVNNTIPQAESSASVDTFCLRFNIHIFHLEWIFCWNLLCLHDTELPNLETCAHVDIKILRNLNIGYILVKQSYYIVLLKMVYMSKNLYFSFNFLNIWCQTCESLNVKVTTHNSCNPGSLQLGLQSLKVKLQNSAKYTFSHLCVICLCPWPCGHQGKSNKKFF